MGTLSCSGPVEEPLVFRPPSICLPRPVHADESPQGNPSDAPLVRVISVYGLSRRPLNEIILQPYIAEPDLFVGCQESKDRSFGANVGTGDLGPSPLPRSPTPIAAPLCERFLTLKMTIFSTNLVPCSPLNLTRQQTSAVMTISLGSMLTAQMMPCSSHPIRGSTR